MKFLSIFLLFYSLIIFEKQSFALTDFQIKEICRKEKSKLNCIKNLELRRSNLYKGNRIKIPVIQYKK